MKSIQRITLIVPLLALISLACQLTGNTANQPTPENPTTAPYGTLESPGKQVSTPETGGEDSILPHTLYYLSNTGTSGFQVLRLGRDGITQTQVTSEAIPVTDFAVSPIDGKVAYLVNNQLYVIHPDGSARTLLIDGGPIDEESPDYHFKTRINGLNWSPDGTTLAFGQNGINIYYFSDSTFENLLPNNLEPLEGVYPFPQALYTPLSWSPDGERLLVDIGFYEGATLGVFDPSSGNVNRLGDFMVCCHPYWSPDSSSVLVGSKEAGILNSGLWRYDAATGVPTELVSESSPNGTLNFVGWPMETPGGELQYFFTNITAFPESGLSLTLVRSGNDGVSARTPLRQERWTLYEVLWAPDGSLLAAVQPYFEVPSLPLDGTIILIDTLGEPVRPLVNGYHMRWGP